MGTYRVSLTIDAEVEVEALNKKDAEHEASSLVSSLYELDISSVRVITVDSQEEEEE